MVAANATFLADLFNPQVIADLIDVKLVDNIVFAPLARVDRTLEGRAGNTVTLPYYTFIGSAVSVGEGEDIPIRKLTQSTKQVEIVKYGIAAQITDESVLSSYGDPIGEVVKQIVTGIADAVDNQLLNALNGNTEHIYTASSSPSADDIAMALAQFGEDSDGQKALICDASFYAKLLKEDWIPASQIAAEVKLRGAAGMCYGCQVIVSNRVHGGNYHIVKPDALALFMKRDTMVETDRDILNQSTVIAGSKLFAPYLLNASNAIKIVSGIDSGLTRIALQSAEGSNTGDTALTVSEYTPASGESYRYKIGDSVETVVIGQSVDGWTEWNGSADITAETGKTLTLVSVDSNGKAVAAGSATVTAKAS